MSRELTREEVQKRFLEHVRAIVRFWNDDPRPRSQEERLSGVAFSILVALDGQAEGLPAFSLCPSPDDKASHQQDGEDFYPEKCDISGGLHEGYSRRLTTRA